MAFQVTPPEKFNFARPEEWPKWARRFERFRHASGLTEKDDETQVNTLLYAMGDEDDDILRSFHLAEADAKKYKTVKERFDGHFVKKRNVIYERARFNQRSQEEGESVDTFITALHGLAEYCNFRELHDEMIRDRIVIGLRDTTLSEKLQLDAELTLEKAVTTARQTEAVKKQQSLLRGEVKPDLSVEVLHRGKLDRGQNRSIGSSQGRPYKKPQTHSLSSTCSRCGKSPLHDRQRCPARDAVCHKCSKRGHFRSCCRSTGVTVQEVSQEDVTDSESPPFFIGGVGDKHSPPWKVTLLLNNKPTEFSIDTGADVTVIPKALFERMHSGTSLQATRQTLYGPSNQTLLVKGRFTGKLKWGDTEIEEEVFVVRCLRRPLLGRPAIESLGLIKRVGAVEMTKDTVEKQFPGLFEGLGQLQGDYEISLKEGAKPHALSTPRRVAIPLLPRVKEELERMEQLGVIERVEQPTEWCAGLVVVPKANGKVRLCVDLTKLNESVRRERHPIPAVEPTLEQLAGATVFSKLDANSGFWQIPLSKESAILTTFISPFGRFCFKRLPFGITSAPEHFQRRMSSLLSGIDGVVCLMDDILIHGTTQEEHDERLARVLTRLQEAGLTLNREKCAFSQDRVSFLGHLIDREGIRPDPGKVAAIRGVQTPSCISDIRRFLGMVNQMIKFAPNLAEVTKPLRDLRKKNQWSWGPIQEKAFNDVKDALSSTPVLALFDPSKQTLVSADASSFGLGAVLKQKQPCGSWRPVAYISRAMNDTEQRYAQIEKEALALTWACERFADYLVGLQFHCETDHKPLVPLLSSKNLDELPLRVQRFRMRLMRFSFSISHVPGKDLVLADTLSRAPLSEPTVADQDLHLEGEAYICAVVNSLPVSERQLSNIQRHQEEDEICRQIVEYCKTSWPDRKKLPGVVKPYYSVASELCVAQGLLLRGHRIVIPASLRVSILDKLHEGHQGISKCRERARQSVWWPGLSKQLEELGKSCPECCKQQLQRAQPLIPTSLPSLPWQKVATDLLEWKKVTYLIVIDYYSRYIEIAKLNRTTTEEVVVHLKSIFARHGIPEEVISDNGPQYSSEEFSKFASVYGFVHTTSSPKYPQSNGEAERAVKTVKGLLNKAEDPYLALLAYRATPLQNGFSPAELLMGRRLRSTVPMIPLLREPKVPDYSEVVKKDAINKRKQKSNFDTHHGAIDLTPLSPGDRVWVTDRGSDATVVTEAAPRSYEVQTPDGTYRRNRRHLVVLPHTSSTTPSSDEGSAESESMPRLTEGSDTCESNDEQPILRRSGRVSKPDRYDPSETIPKGEM